MNLQNTKLYIPEDLWEIIQNILIYECGYCFLKDFKKSDWHPYLYIGSDNYLTIGDDFEYFKVNLNKEISYKDILKMNNTEKYIKVSLKQAREWWKSDNETLKTIANTAFTVSELTSLDFRNIKTWEDALVEYCKNDNFSVSHYKRMQIKNTIESLEYYSPASAEMFKLNIIRKVLNKDYELFLTETPDDKYTYFPFIRFITKDSTYYEDLLKTGECKKIGTIINKGITYDVISGCTDYNGTEGIGNFGTTFGIGGCNANIGFFGCATEEIAAHFGKYFGMLILKAMYSDVIKDIKFN